MSSERRTGGIGSGAARVSPARRRVRDRLDERHMSEKALLDHYAQSHDPRLEEQLVERLMPLARALARRYRGTSERHEDLLQVASLALVKALRGFDPARGVPFAAYAAPTILGELRRHFRDHAWSLHVPRGLQERTLEVERTIAELSDHHGRSPSVIEVAERTGLDEEAVLEAMGARDSRMALSLDEPGHSSDGELAPLVEHIATVEAGFDKVESQAAAIACAGLDEREREVIELRFEHDLNQYEIGRRLGVSQMQVSRILRRGLAKLLEAVQGDEHPDGARTFAYDGADPRLPAKPRTRRQPAA